MEGSIGYPINVRIIGSGTIMSENLETGEKVLFYNDETGATVSRPYP
jgi:hypothetical protein